MNEDGNGLVEGWVDAETGRAYSMEGLWLKPVFWLQRIDLYFYKNYIDIKLTLWFAAAIIIWRMI